MADNGVIRIGRKGRKKFAFGEDGQAFEVNVVSAMQEWIILDGQFRDERMSCAASTDEARTLKDIDIPEYHKLALSFSKKCAAVGGVEVIDICEAEALDFLARLRECYDEMVDFFHPKSREKRGSPDSSEPALQFSEEPSEN